MWQNLRWEINAKFKEKIHRHVSSFQVIILGFMLVILLGSLCLTLPLATRDGQGASFLDALFTSTSAVCVTGLVLHDTASYWSMFGQAVILFLIQIGGMGVVTVSVAVAIFSGRKISLMQRSTMRESISAPQVGGIVRMTEFILKTVFLVELLGAVAMAPVFVRDFGFLKGVWYAMFHSISAFCNAGFDLMGHTEKYISLCNYVGDWLVNLVIVSLIVIGGIGFIVWDDLYTKRWHVRHYMLHTKIVLVTTAILIAGSMLLFYMMERGNILVGMTGSDKFLACLFSAVTPRTAGFNTVDTAALTDGSKFLTAVLMFIGGSPGSTAGGIKTTTLMVLLFYVVSNVRQTYGVEVFGRRLQDESIRQSACILTINLCLTIVASILIMTVQNLPMSAVLFETCSAMGTSGMSTGVTRSLNTFSRFMIIMLMYCGRIGSLSFALAFTRTKRKPHVQLPPERITVG